MSRLHIARGSALLWLIGGFVLLVMGSKAPGLFAGVFPDTDDLLRLQQVRDLIAGQAWYNVDQGRLLTPEGGALHWSRIPDIFLFTLISLFTPLFGVETAEYIAALIWPLLLLALLLGGLVWILRQYRVSLVGQVLGIVFLATSS